MQMSHFSNWIQQRIQKPLPGAIAHGTIWSYPRNSFEDALQMNPPPRHSAVNLILKESDKSLELGFIVRSDFGIHGGQVAFPGGKIHPGESYKECANRETEEEIGILPNTYFHLGALSPVFIPPSNMLVFPMLKLIHKLDPLKLDTREIEDFFWIEISELLPTKIIEKEHYLKAFDTTRMIKGIPLKNHFLWGASAMITQELCHLWLEFLNENETDQY